MDDLHLPCKCNLAACLPAFVFLVDFNDTVLCAQRNIIIWPAPLAGKINRILCCDWLPERARWSFIIWPAGARFSKAPVNTGPANLPGRLTGNFTGPGRAFLEALVNFPGTYRAR